jgi:hypothetical protein
MNSFKNFFETTEFVYFILNEFDGSNIAAPETTLKPWSAKKADILQMWKTLKPNMPIILTPIEEKPEGTERSSYGEDGVRITGSPYFISSVLGRLKEIIGYENPETKLRLVFRSVDKGHQSRSDRQSYVFYINLERRSRGKPGRRKNPTIKTI